MKILVTGSSGMLGWGIKQMFKDEEMIYTDKESLDVINYEQVMAYARHQPEVIIHCAAETNHYIAEINPYHAYLTNAIGTAHVCNLAKECDAVMVYISTGGIFDGKKKTYSYLDEPSPINHYSRSKWYGERFVKTLYKYYIIRAGWMMGGGEEIDHKFIGQIYKQIKQGKKIYAINNVYGTPTYSVDLARFIKFLINSKLLYRIWHYPNKRVSRYDVAKEFVRLLGDHVPVIQVTYDEYHRKIPVSVPYTKCEALLSTHPIIEHWKVGLADYVRQCFK